MAWGNAETKNELLEVKYLKNEEFEYNHDYVREVAKQSYDVILKLERRITKLEKENRFLRKQLNGKGKKSDA